MTDPKAAKDAGLKEITKETCLKCHVQNCLKETFDYDKAVAKITHSTKLPKASQENRICSLVS